MCLVLQLNRGLKKQKLSFCLKILYVIYLRNHSRLIPYKNFKWIWRKIDRTLYGFPVYQPSIGVWARAYVKSHKLQVEYLKRHPILWALTS